MNDNRWNNLIKEIKECTTDAEMREILEEFYQASYGQGYNEAADAINADDEDF